MTSIYGWLASLSTIIYRLPQIYRLYKIKQSTDLSFYSLILQGIGCILYIIHGIIIKDNPIIVMGSGTLLQTLIIIILYLKYYKKKDIIENENSDKSSEVNTNNIEISPSN